MHDKHSYKHMRYDVSILQSRTVNNMIEALVNGRKHNNVNDVLNHLIELFEKAKVSGVGRKANTLDKKIAKLKKMGYTINKEGE